MLSYFLENRLTDGGEVVNLTRRLLFTPKKINEVYTINLLKKQKFIQQDIHQRFAKGDLGHVAFICLRFHSFLAAHPDGISD
jgi:hypothetical protein